MVPEGEAACFDRVDEEMGEVARDCVIGKPGVLLAAAGFPELPKGVDEVRELP